MPLSLVPSPPFHRVPPQGGARRDSPRQQLPDLSREESLGPVLGGLSGGLISLEALLDRIERRP